MSTQEILEVTSPSWMLDAVCGSGEYPLDWWYPEPGQNEYVEAATRVCRGCPVVAQCLRWAFETEDRWAILGGKTANQRKRILSNIQWKK